VNEDTKNPEQNEKHSLRTRVADYIRRITRPELAKDLLLNFANTYIYTRYSLNIGVVQYISFASMNRVDSVANTLFNREVNTQEETTSLTSFAPDNIAQSEVVDRELQVA
jgi:hypothetical protein